MEITEIPFAKTIGLKRSSSGILELHFEESVHNHLQTVAASAQFSLAEFASGRCLQQLFPELAGKVLPVLRDSRFKFKRPALSKISAFPEVPQKSVDRFTKHFETKGRALIVVDVSVKDVEGTETSCGSFTWYVQSL
jgi:acyl-coenzyme A thioesterase PaaI-like protein